MHTFTIGVPGVYVIRSPRGEPGYVGMSMACVSARAGSHRDWAEHCTADVFPLPHLSKQQILYAESALILALDTEVNVARHPDMTHQIAAKWVAAEFHELQEEVWRYWEYERPDDYAILRTEESMWDWVRAWRDSA